MDRGGVVLGNAVQGGNFVLAVGEVHAAVGYPAPSSRLAGVATQDYRGTGIRVDRPVNKIVAVPWLGALIGGGGGNSNIPVGKVLPDIDLVLMTVQCEVEC